MGRGSCVPAHLAPPLSQRVGSRARPPLVLDKPLAGWLGHWSPARWHAVEVAARGEVERNAPPLRAVVSMRWKRHDHAAGVGISLEAELAASLPIPGVSQS